MTARAQLDEALTAVTDMINIQRETAMEQTVSRLYVLKDSLLHGRPGCRFECDVMCLGALMKGIHDCKIDDIESDFFRNKSFVGMNEKILAMKLPQVPIPARYDARCSSYHCSLRECLNDICHSVEQSIDGLVLADFAATPTKGRKKTKGRLIRST